MKTQMSLHFSYTTTIESREASCAVRIFAHFELRAHVLLVLQLVISCIVLYNCNCIHAIQSLDYNRIDSISFSDLPLLSLHIHLTRCSRTLRARLHSRQAPLVAARGAREGLWLEHEACIYCITMWLALRALWRDCRGADTRPARGSKLTLLSQRER